MTCAFLVREHRRCAPRGRHSFSNSERYGRVPFNLVRFCQASPYCQKSKRISVAPMNSNACCRRLILQRKLLHGFSTMQTLPLRWPTSIPTAVTWAKWLPSATDFWSDSLRPGKPSGWLSERTGGGPGLPARRATVMVVHGVPHQVAITYGDSKSLNKRLTVGHFRRSYSGPSKISQLATCKCAYWLTATEKRLVPEKISITRARMGARTRPICSLPSLSARVPPSAGILDVSPQLVFSLKSPAASQAAAWRHTAFRCLG